MSRKGFATIIIIAIIAGAVIGGGVIGDKVLKDQIGMGLLDVIKFILGSSSTQQNAPSIEDVKTQIGITKYNQLINEKETMNNQFLTAKEHLTELNNNTDAVNILNAAFGEDYKINLFSIATIGNLSFKVFDWSITLKNGQVTDFSNNTYEKYNVYVQASQDVAYNLFTGNINPEEVPEWIKGNKLKINPITEVTRFINALPQVINMIQERS